jgi:hypothetical protein
LTPPPHHASSEHEKGLALRRDLFSPLLLRLSLSRIIRDVELTQPELALILTLLTPWVLLLLAGPLPAALLLARFLVRILALLTGILVLTAHSGSPF